MKTSIIRKRAKALLFYADVYDKAKCALLHNQKEMDKEDKKSLMYSYLFTTKIWYLRRDKQLKAVLKFIENRIKLIEI